MNDSIFDLDENSLDELWKGQAKLHHKWSCRLADARRDHEIAKSELELVMAELDLQIRDNPEMFEIGKLTENSIKNTIIAQKEYRLANRQVIDAKHHVDIIAAKVFALDDRKKALENMVQLFLSDYYAEPRAKGERAQRHVDQIRTRQAFRPQKRIEVEDD